MAVVAWPSYIAPFWEPEPLDFPLFVTQKEQIAIGLYVHLELGCGNSWPIDSSLMAIRL